MDPAVAQLSYILAIGTIALQVITAGVLLLLFFKKGQLLRAVRPYQKFILPIAFVTALAGSVLTLVYSEMFGIAPCGWCWIQRIFLYPVPIVLAVAMWTRDSAAGKYVLAFSIPGALSALYHHSIQMGGSDFLPCPATGVSCSQRIIFEFGYITFPLMAFTTFVFLIALMLIYRALLKRM